jgi:hypothetical protein
MLRVNDEDEQREEARACDQDAHSLTVGLLFTVGVVILLSVCKEWGTTQVEPASTL